MARIILSSSIICSGFQNDMSSLWIVSINHKFPRWLMIKKKSEDYASYVIYLSLESLKENDIVTRVRPYIVFYTPIWWGIIPKHYLDNIACMTVKYIYISSYLHRILSKRKTLHDYFWSFVTSLGQFRPILNAFMTNYISTTYKKMINVACWSCTSKKPVHHYHC